MAENARTWAEKMGFVDTSPSPRNLRPVVFLTDPFRIPFRGRMWEIPPVSFEDGIKVLELVTWFQEARENPGGALSQYRTQMRRAIHLIRKLVRPERGLVRRLRWRLRLHRNPWRTATHEELGEILGFFWMRRTTLVDRHPFLKEEDGRKGSTSWTNGRSSASTSAALPGHGKSSST